MNEFTSLCDCNTSSPLLWPETHPIYLPAHWACIMPEADPIHPHCLLSGGGLHSHATGGKMRSSKGQDSLRSYDSLWFIPTCNDILGVPKWSGLPRPTCRIHCSSHRSGRERHSEEVIPVRTEQARPAQVTTVTGNKDQLSWICLTSFPPSSGKGTPSFYEELLLSHSMKEALPVRILCPSVHGAL